MGLPRPRLWSLDFCSATSYSCRAVACLRSGGGKTAGVDTADVRPPVICSPAWQLRELRNQGLDAVTAAMLAVTVLTAKIVTSDVMTRRLSCDILCCRLGTPLDTWVEKNARQTGQEMCFVRCSAGGSRSDRARRRPGLERRLCSPKNLVEHSRRCRRLPSDSRYLAMTSGTYADVVKRESEAVDVRGAGCAVCRGEECFEC